VLFQGIENHAIAILNHARIDRLERVSLAASLLRRHLYQFAARLQFYRHYFAADVVRLAGLTSRSTIDLSSVDLKECFPGSRRTLK
jgi:hypothetical protein